MPRKQFLNFHRGSGSTKDGERSKATTLSRSGGKKKKIEAVKSRVMIVYIQISAQISRLYCRSSSPRCLSARWRANCLRLCRCCRRFRFGSNSLLAMTRVLASSSLIWAALTSPDSSSKPATAVADAFAAEAAAAKVHGWE